MRDVKQIAFNYSSRNGTRIKYIVIHDTGNQSKGADAEAHYKYFNGDNRDSSADFFVDDIQTLCVNDYRKYYTWHCGDGHGKYGITNANSIGVEFCVNSDCDHEKAIANLLVLVRELMTELDIPIDRVVRHYDASRKNCPASMGQNNWHEWHEFKKNLMNKGGLSMSQYEELLAMINEQRKIYNKIDDIPDFAKPSVQKLCDKGLLKGSESGLGLTYDMLRILVIIDRTGVFD